MTSKVGPSPALAALACLFSALCCAGAYISIPIPLGPVPMAVTNLFAVLSGLLLGPLWGAISSLAYLALGALGLPVFSGGRGGLAHLAGPTGGYLAGYVAASIIAGILGRSRRWPGIALGSVLGFASILALGAAGLHVVGRIAWEPALVGGIVPFLPGDAIKAVLAALICRRMGAFVDSLTGRAYVRS